MKKIITTLFLIINVLLFFRILDVYRHKDFVDMLTLTRYQPDVTHIAFGVDNRDQGIDTQSMLDLLKELTDRYDLMISVSLGNYMEEQFEYYIAMDAHIDKRLGLVADHSVNFNETDEYFYINKKADTNGIYFYLLNKDLDVKIFPMTQLNEILSTNYMFTSSSKEELNEAITIFMDNFGSYVTDKAEFHSVPYVVQVEINAFLPTTVLIAMSCTFLLLIMYVHTKSKIIAIYKTMGTLLFTTANRMFFSLFLTIVFTVSITNLLLFSIFIRVINERTIPIVIDLAKSGLFQFIGVFATIALSCFLLTFIPTYSLLKNSSVNRYLMNVNYVMKIVVLVMILPTVSETTSFIREHLAIANYADNPSVGSYQFVPGFKMEYESEQYSTSEYLEYISKYFENLDRDIIYSFEPLHENHRAYDILNDAGAIYCESYTISMDESESGIKVNENYMKKYPIMDVNGIQIDLDKIESDLVYFVPEFYFERYSGDFYAVDPWENPSESFSGCSLNPTLPSSLQSW